jgi:hypothetical protein
VITKFLPVEILELVGLRTLTLSHCQRLAIPPQLGDMPALESFCVRDAAVSFHSAAFLPDCFSSRTLTRLELVGCRLDVLPHQVKQAPVHVWRNSMGMGNPCITSCFPGIAR